MKIKMIKIVDFNSIHILLACSTLHLLLTIKFFCMVQWARSGKMMQKNKIGKGDNTSKINVFSNIQKIFFSIFWNIFRIFSPLVPCSFRDKSLKVLSWIPSSSKGGKQHRKRHLRRRLVRLAALMWTTLNPFFYFFFFVIYEVRSLCDKWNASSKNGLRVNIIKRGIHAHTIPWQVRFFEEGKKLWGYSRIVPFRYLLPMMMLRELHYLF